MTIDDIINTGNCSTAEILVLKNIKFREVENHVLEVHKNKISQNVVPRFKILSDRKAAAI